MVGIFCGLISMAMMPDACNVFVGFMPVNSTYINDALIQDMINEYGQDHRQGMQGIVHCMQDCALYARYCSLYARWYALKSERTTHIS
jgi:hypothetical protein